jgi:hypothetical protein
MRAAGLCVVFSVITVGSAAAQEIGGYVTAGSGSIDYLVSRETILQASAGVLWRVANDRIRFGAEAEALTSNGYWTGKGGPFAEVVLFRRERISPFVRGGRFFGEDTSWIAGAGIDVWLTETGGLRLMVQDGFRQSRITSIYGNRSSTFHEPSFQVGWTWR